MSDHIAQKPFLMSYKLPASPGLKLFTSRLGKFLRYALVALMFAVVAYSAIYTIGAYSDIQACIGAINNAMQLG